MKAQSLGEYVLVVSMIIAFMAVMFPMVKRGTQSIIKVSADQIGIQKNADQTFTPDSGWLDSSNTITHSISEKSQQDIPGAIIMGTSVNIDSSARSLTNMGFSKE